MLTERARATSVPCWLRYSVSVTAKVMELALPRVVFEVEVKDEIDTVGKSKHIRFVVDKAKQAGAQKMEQVKEQARQTVGEIKDAATDATTKATQSKFSPSGTA